jgi:ATP-binding cassette subfamily F protein 3
VAYFAQHQLDELAPAQSAYDHVRQLMPDATEAVVRARTGAFGFPRGKMDTPARDLSGGEKARLLLGLATFAGPNLMILDEPTNHLDIDSREALVMALAEYSGAVILISHDRHLIEASVDRLWLVADGTASAYEGDLDEYRRMVLEARGRANGDDDAKSDGNAALQRRREAARRREETAPLRRRIKDAETTLDRLRKEIQAIDQRLADGALYVRNPTEAARLAKSRAEATRAIATTEETWLTLAAELEAAGS